MPGAMPLPSGAFCARGAFAARAAFDLRAFAGTRDLRLGAVCRAVFRRAFRAVFRRTVRLGGRLLMRRGLRATGYGLQDSPLTASQRIQTRDSLPEPGAQRLERFRLQPVARGP